MNPIAPESHPTHGGQLAFYAEHYGIEIHKWMDLSTGINPSGYQVENLSLHAVQSLPNLDDGLNEAAAHYYQCASLLMVPGSSWAIHHLPRVLKTFKTNIGNVLLPKVGYQEHLKAWHGANIFFYDDTPTQEQLTQCDVCVMINPNNPTAKTFKREQVLLVAKQLHEHQGMLVVDEAFIDTAPHLSVATERPDNVIVLRSLGKFFGLAGLRVGTVIASDVITNALAKELPPWAINHPARYIATQALQDKQWIDSAKAQLRSSSERLAALLTHNLSAINSLQGIERHDLFVTVFMSDTEVAMTLHHGLCQQGVLTRLLDNKKGIRFGLPKQMSSHWQQLQEALRNGIQIMKQRCERA